jgi:hypothetical protein
MNEKLVGAFVFGAVIGWFVYHTLRYRRGPTSLDDIAKLIGMIGGGAVLVLFPEKSEMFAWYGIGLGAGFFGYFLVLVLLVASSSNFGVDWFLDGRRKKPTDPIELPDQPQRPMGA